MSSRESAYVLIYVFTRLKKFYCSLYRELTLQAIVNLRLPVDTTNTLHLLVLFVDVGSHCCSFIISAKPVLLTKV